MRSIVSGILIYLRVDVCEESWVFGGEEKTERGLGLNAYRFVQALTHKTRSLAAVLRSLISCTPAGVCFVFSIISDHRLDQWCMHMPVDWSSDWARWVKKNLTTESQNNMQKRNQTSRSSDINFCEVKVMYKMAYRCSKFNACCLLRRRNNLTLNVCLCRTTMTLHQGQGHQNEQRIVCHS